MDLFTFVLLIAALSALAGFVGFLLGELRGMDYYWPSVLSGIQEREELREQLLGAESPEWEDGAGI